MTNVLLFKAILKSILKYIIQHHTVINVDELFYSDNAICINLI